MPRNIRGKDADLAVRDLPGRARILTGNPAGGLALLEKSGFIDDQNRILVCEMLDHIIADNVTQLIGIPAAAAKNSLLAPGSGIARRLRAHPARFCAARFQAARRETIQPKLPPALA